MADFLSGGQVLCFYHMPRSHRDCWRQRQRCPVLGLSPPAPACEELPKETNNFHKDQGEFNHRALVWGQLLFFQAKTSAPSIWQMLFPSGSIHYPLLYRSEVYPTCLLGWSRNFSFLSCSTLTDICVSILKTTLAVKQQKCRTAVCDRFQRAVSIHKCTSIPRAARKTINVWL